MDQETNVLDATEDAAVEATDDTVDELLIEELSIDGMCGVY
jgi:mycofactocin precursor